MVPSPNISGNYGKILHKKKKCKKKKKKKERKKKSSYLPYLFFFFFFFLTCYRKHTYFFIWPNRTCNKFKQICLTTCLRNWWLSGKQILIRWYCQQPLFWVYSFYGHSLPSPDSRRAVISFWWMNVNKHWSTTQRTKPAQEKSG